MRYAELSPGELASTQSQESLPMNDNGERFLRAVFIPNKNDGELSFRAPASAR